MSNEQSMEAALRESEESLRLVLETGHIGIWNWNIQTGVVHWSGDAALLQDFAPVPLEGTAPDTYLSSLHPDDRDRIVEIINTVTIEGGDYETEFRSCLVDGSIRWVSVRGYVSLDENREPSVMRGVALDITRQKEAERIAAEQRERVAQQRDELEKVNARLEALAVTDGLTGLKNHRAFQELLEREFYRAREFKTSLTLLLIDVDKFKQYNDTFGHPAGDSILIAVSNSLRSMVRESDIVARYGGEEFAVILPGTDRYRALQIAERIRAAVESSVGENGSVTVSIGLAVYSDDLQSRTQLVVEADRALYRAKRTGRNRVIDA